MMKETFADFVKHSINNAYILKWSTPIKYNDYRVWFKYLENRHKTRVRFTKLKNDVYVSTVFLVLDHNNNHYFKTEAPILFETIVKVNNQWTGNPLRCATWRQALLMHSKTVTEWRILLHEDTRNRQRME